MVREFSSHVKTLNCQLKDLPTLKNSPMAVATTKKGNILFGYAEQDNSYKKHGGEKGLAYLTSMHKAIQKPSCKCLISR